MGVDRRARLRPKERAEDAVYGAGGILNTLRLTQGMVWPYTPSVNVVQSMDYASYDPVHTNQEFLTFTRSRAAQITCSGMFTAQTAEEARYVLACLHFLRSVTKMDFGDNAETPGTPPPILLFSAYGDLMMNDLPVVVTNFTYDLPQDKDYVEVSIPIESTGSEPNIIPYALDSAVLAFRSSETESGTTATAWVPTEITIAVSMTVQNTPKRLTEDFDLEKFKSGSLLTGNKKGWI